MMNFGQFNIGYMNLPANVFSFMPMQNTSASSMGNIFGIGVVQQPSYNFSMSPLSSDSFYNYWNNNQAQLQQLMLDALIQIMSNPPLPRNARGNIHSSDTRSRRPSDRLRSPDSGISRRFRQGRIADRAIRRR